MAEMEDVVRILSNSAIEVILAQIPAVRNLTVSLVTSCVSYWEENSVVLDPVSREVVLNSLVISFIATANSYVEIIVDGLGSSRSANSPCEISPTVHGS